MFVITTYYLNRTRVEIKSKSEYMRQIYDIDLDNTKEGKL